MVKGAGKGENVMKRVIVLLAAGTVLSGVAAAYAAAASAKAEPRVEAPRRG
jgi:hypothetical protein